VTGAAGIPIDPSWFIRPDGQDASATIHGVAHTTRVHIHALEIAEALELDAWERDALHYAAMWHDIGRTNDSVDPTHGAKSAEKVFALGLQTDVGLRTLEVALFAITHHSRDDRHAERAALSIRAAEAYLRVFRVLKDADGLDRVRLGAGDLDVGMLRFDVSRTRVDRAWELLREIG
jgi:HD superfamily phosphodiesterase